MFTRILALALLFAPFLSASAEEWTKTFNVTGKPTVEVHADDGNVRLRPCDCKTVEARVVSQGYRANELKITSSQTGDHVELDVLTHGIHFGIGFHRQRLDIELTVPRESALNVRTGDGNIDAEQLKGEFRLNTGDGNIELHSIDGTLQAKSGDGHMDIGGRFDALDLQSGDGSIRAEIAAGSKVNSEWSVHTGDGRITMRLPKDFSAELDAHSSDGRVHSELPVTMDMFDSRHDKDLHGKLNGGGGELRLRSGDGSIYLETL